MSTKIAVFIPARDERQMRLQPAKQFKIIRSVQDIRGCEFSGIITYFDWYFDKDKEEAFAALISRQPELYERP